MVSQSPRPSDNSISSNVSPDCSSSSVWILLTCGSCQHCEHSVIHSCFFNYLASSIDFLDLKLPKLADMYRLQLPAYPTTMFRQNDDEGVILVLYFKVSNSFDKEISPPLRDNIKCYE